MTTTASHQGQVKIGREFFAKIKLDYADWRWALVREFLQNCFDAPGCRNVEVCVATDGRVTTLTVSNDGAPMSREVLTEKLLTLGGSGKNFDGENTGGFGVAKSLLYYCHLGYVISTGGLLVRGEGAQYSISEQSHLAGTTSLITLDGDEAQSLMDNVRRFAAFAQWRGTLKLDGEVLATDTHKGARRKDLGWGVVYTNNSFSNTCVVRLNGQPMFTRYTRFKGCVLVELSGKAKDSLTSNRDALNRKLDSELSDLLTALAVDKKSALREQRAEYRRYAGEVQKNEAKKARAVGDGLAAVIDVAQVAALAGGQVVYGCAVAAEPTPDTAAGGGGIRLVVESNEDAPVSISVGPQFVLKNSTGMKTPTYYTPGEGFTRYSRDLVRAWTGLMLKLHQLLDRSGEFSVGFTIDEESEAECERGVYGRVYYVNPVRVVTDGGKRRLEQRFESAWNDRFTLISLACHEFVHGAYGLSDHDEDYAGKLTDVMAAAMANLCDLTTMCLPVKLAAGTAGTGPIVEAV